MKSKPNLRGPKRRNVPPEQIAKEFWMLVDKNGPMPDPETGVRSQCWIWLGGLNDQGYGRFRRNGQNHYVTRYAWTQKGRELDPENVLTQRCGNRICVRHLMAEPRAKSAARHNRVRGEQSYNTKLTDRQVLHIRKTYLAGRKTNPELAKQYGLSRGAIRNIVRGISWSHI